MINERTVYCKVVVNGLQRILIMCIYCNMYILYFQIFVLLAQNIERVPFTTTIMLNITNLHDCRWSSLSLVQCSPQPIGTDW